MEYPYTAQIWRWVETGDGRYGQPTGSHQYSHDVQCIVYGMMSSIRASFDAPALEYTMLTPRTEDIKASDSIDKILTRSGDVFLADGQGTIVDIMPTVIDGVKQAKVTWSGS